MFLAVTSESKVIAGKDMERAVNACTTQIKQHVAPTWDRIPAHIILCEDKKEIPAVADVLTVLDDSDQSGYAGYHRVAPEGKAYSRVFVKPILIHGGELLTTSLSVSSVMSHEICEWFVNRSLDLWVDGPQGEYALEICDPVSEDAYEIDGVSVSNFVYRLFFDGRAPAACQFDHLRRVRGPFTPSAGGYMHLRKIGEMQMIRGGPEGIL